jgi:hypothetical protein
MKSNITFTNATGKYNCSQILNTSISLPLTCGDSGDGSINCNPSTRNTTSGGILVGVAVGVSLGVIIILASTYFCWRRRRTNKRILSSSGTTKIQGPDYASGPKQDLEKNFTS